MATKKLMSSDDFGVIARGPDDVEVCRSGGAYQHSEKCRIIDDVVIYLGSGKVSGAAVAAIEQQAATSSRYFKNTPPGRLTDFYRALIAVRLYNKYARSAPTLRQVLTILDITENPRARDDDYADIDTAVRAILGVKLTPEEQVWADAQKRAIEAAGFDIVGASTSTGGGARTGGGSGSGGGASGGRAGGGAGSGAGGGAGAGGDGAAPPKAAAKGGGGIAAAVALGTGGFFVGGPVGAGVGFVVGLLAGK